MSRIHLSESEIRTYFESQVPKLHKVGEELRAPCPLHHGKRDSLAIGAETGQWFCHSGCAKGGSIFDFEAALAGSDEKTAIAEVLRIVGRASENGTAKGQIVRTYDYVDEAGTLIYQTVRLEPKDFRQRRPDGQGGWLWNLKGARRVLYHLPAVMAAPFVIVCEGEKDAEALTGLGFVATCNPMGTGKWRAEFSEFLRGKQVIVIPDGDSVGRQHSDDVMKSLQGVAAFAKLVELPGCHDASDWIASGGTPEALVALMEQPEVNTPPAAESGAKLLEKIEQYIRRYVVLSESAYLPISLWVIATHAVLQFDCFPYIAAISAAKRSGKTRLVEVLVLLVRRGWHGTAPSPAALYRMLEGAPTLLLDETEMLNAKNRSETALILLAVLNAGHRKGATIPRCEGPRQEVRQFRVYGAKCFAAIGRLPDTLLDRSIVIHMKRKSKTQAAARFRIARATAEAKPIHDMAAQFSLSHAGDIERAYQEVTDADLGFLNDRDADLWTPLFTICSLTSPERLKELEKCALVLSMAKAGDDADDSWPLALLRDIRAVWPDGEEKFATANLLERLKALEESPWQEHQLTPRKLARTLKPFEVEPRTIRTGECTQKGYFFDHLKDAFDRYLDEKSVTCDTAQ